MTAGTVRVICPHRASALHHDGKQNREGWCSGKEQEDEADLARELMKIWIY
jgi:hypothetical protein